jgi:hypothetical protein
MGGGGGSSKTTTSQGQTTQNYYENKDPWSGQQPYLAEAFQQAQQQYQKSQANPGYTGDFYATPDPGSVDLFNKYQNYASGEGMQSGINTARLGYENAAWGSSNLGSATHGIFQMAGKDQTKGQIASAGQYADNPYMSGMVDAAMRDARRTYSEETVPGIDRNAAATGNMNSTRTAIAQGVADRGLQEKAADVSATMRGQAYSQGLDLASKDTDRKLAAYQAAGGLANDRLSAGLQGQQMGAGMLSDFFTVGTNAAAGLDEFNQRAVDNARMKAEYPEQRSWENLGRYYGLIGANNWGGTTTGNKQQTESSREKVKNDPGALATIGGLLGAAGSFAKLGR